MRISKKYRANVYLNIILIVSIVMVGMVGLADYMAEADDGYKKKPGDRESFENYNQSRSSTFKDYWFDGEAEITSYALKQARYGVLNEGTAVTIFVKEPFSRSEQVKLDNPDETPDRLEVPVMKLNMTKKFTTGIYPYSMMMSTFTPVYGKPGTLLKLSTSSQEWCGHTFMQLNDMGDYYNALLRSYFESEGDRDRHVERVLAEDELWTQIKLDPSGLPVGEKELLPSTFYLRLRHQPLKPEHALLTLETVKDERFSKDELKKYEIHYPSHDRRLSIYFKDEFPYIIEGWEESYISGFKGVGDGPQRLTTTAIRKKTIKTAYWEKNQPGDEVLRDSLELID